VRLLALLAACVLALPAMADWTPVTTTPEGDTHFYDGDRLHLDGDAVTYWRKVEFATPLQRDEALAQTGLYRERIDCGERELRMLGYLHYAADGSTIEDVYVPDAPGLAIAEGSPASRMEALVCPLVTAAPKSAPGDAESGDELQRLREEIEALQDSIRRLREGLPSQKSADAAR
jgi:hypothetical protein